MIPAKTFWNVSMCLTLSNNDLVMPIENRVLQKIKQKSTITEIDKKQLNWYGHIVSDGNGIIKKKASRNPKD